MYSNVPPPEQRLRADEGSFAGTDSDEKDKPLPGISADAWKKFQELKKRREECSKKTTEKRIRDVKRTAFKTVLASCSSAEEKDLLSEHAVKSTKRQKKTSTKETGFTSERTEVTPELQASWADIKPHMHSSDNLRDDSSRAHSVQKNKLERRINQAIECGDLSLAEELSTDLAEDELKTKLQSAVTARKYAKKKQDEEASRPKKRAKLHWGFEEKQRWESKSNM